MFQAGDLVDQHLWNMDEKDFCCERKIPIPKHSLGTGLKTKPSSSELEIRLKLVRNKLFKQAIKLHYVHSDRSGSHEEPPMIKKICKKQAEFRPCSVRAECHW
jgi:hypothetical protein